MILFPDDFLNRIGLPSIGYRKGHQGQRSMLACPYTEDPSNCPIVIQMSWLAAQHLVQDRPEYLPEKADFLHTTRWVKMPHRYRANNWKFCPVDKEIPAIAAMHGPHSVFDIGQCTVIHCDAGCVSLVDQWKAEKNWYSFNRPITRCFHKPIKVKHDYRALKQNRSYQPTLAGRAIIRQRRINVDAM